MNQNKLLLSLGERLREWRQKRNLSQEQLAGEAGLDRTYVSLVERGKRNPSFTNLYKLAKAMEISVSELTKGI